MTVKQIVGYIDICGMRFYKHRTKVRRINFEEKRLQNFYKEPSPAKIRAQEVWDEWFTNFDHSTWTVSSANVYTFTIRGYITIGDIDYMVYITPTRNDLYEVEG